LLLDPVFPSESSLPAVYCPALANQPISRCGATMPFRVLSGMTGIIRIA
jgi:hypothetical protein